jgi:hypothetical protein
MSESSRLVVAPPEVRAQVLSMIQHLGVRETAKRLGIGRDSTRRIREGVPVTLATWMLAQSKLGGAEFDDG